MTMCAMLAYMRWLVHWGAGGCVDGVATHVCSIPSLWGCYGRLGRDVGWARRTEGVARFGLALLGVACIQPRPNQCQRFLVQSRRGKWYVHGRKRRRARHAAVSATAARPRAARTRSALAALGAHDMLCPTWRLGVCALGRAGLRLLTGRLHRTYPRVLSATRPLGKWASGAGRSPWHGEMPDAGSEARRCHCEDRA